jgi:hypothetical protein
LPIFFQSISNPPDFYGKGGTDPDSAFNTDFALHNVNHSFNKRKTQAISLDRMGRIALIKLLEDMCAHFGSHSATGVFYFDDGVM